MTLKARAALVLVAVALAAAACSAYLARGVPLQTNLLAMLPPTERDPVAEEVVAKLAGAVGGRVVFMVSHERTGPARHAAEIFTMSLQQAGGLRAVMAHFGTVDLSLPAKLYAAHGAYDWAVSALDRALRLKPGDADLQRERRLAQEMARD